MVDHMIQARKASEDLQVKVDKGLMAQVVANLFSNAIKYTEWVADRTGNKVKTVDCTILLSKDFFGSGHHGVRFDVLTSGPTIDPAEGARIFDEGFRIGREGSVEGMGHGLHFVKNVVEVHGGVVGHKGEEQGNDFYFIIPR
jgi:signal transduction histidine kinase